MQKTFTDVNFGRKGTFTVTDTFPEGYVVWPIGRRNFPHPGFVPLARTTEVPFQVSLKGLMALRCRNETEALHILKKAITGDYVRNKNVYGINAAIFKDLTEAFVMKSSTKTSA